MSAAAIGNGLAIDAPAPGLKMPPLPVDTFGEARSDFSAACEAATAADKAYDQARLDADPRDVSQRAAASYLAGGNAAEADALVTRSAGAKAALPALRERVKTAETAKQLARGAFRSAIASEAAAKRKQSIARYVAAARELQAAYIEMCAHDRVLRHFSPTTGPLHLPMLHPISAVCPEGERPCDPYLPGAMIPDATALENVAIPRAVEIERDLRARAGDRWPFDPEPAANYRLSDK